MRIIYANVLLSNGKLLFWYTGDKCNEFSFYKDFYYAGLNELEYRSTHDVCVKNIGFIDETEEEDYNQFIFNNLAKEFYKQFELSEDYKGRKPY